MTDPPGTLHTIAFWLGVWCVVAVVAAPFIGAWLRRLRKRQTTRVERGDRS